MSDDTYRINGEVTIEKRFIESVRKIAREEAQNANGDVSEDAIVERVYDRVIVKTLNGKTPRAEYSALWAPLLRSCSHIASVP